MGLSCEEASEGLCFSGKRWWQPPGPREGRGGCLSLSPRSSGRLSPPCAGVEPLPARPPVCWPLSPCSPPVCSPTPGQLLLPRQALTRPAQPAATPGAVFTLTTPLRGPAGSSPGLCSCCAPPPSMCAVLLEQLEGPPRTTVAGAVPRRPVAHFCWCCSPSPAWSSPAAGFGMNAFLLGRPEACGSPGFSRSAQNLGDLGSVGDHAPYLSDRGSHSSVFTGPGEAWS